MSNKYLARLNLTSMLSTDEALKAGIGHNVGDPLDILADDVTTYEQALAVAQNAHDGLAKHNSEGRTYKVSALVSVARAARKVGLKPDMKDKKWTDYLRTYTGAVTDGSLAKESSILARAIELDGKALLVPAVRAAENYVAAGKAMGKQVKAFENVFESVASLTRKNSAVPSYDDMAKADSDGNSKLFRPDAAQIEAKKAAKKLEAEKAAREASNVAPEDVAARFISQFMDVAKNMDDASYEKEVAEIAETLLATRRKAKADAEAAAKAAEAASATDVGTKGRKGKRAAAK